MFFSSLLLLIAYLIWSTWIGTKICRRLRIQLNNRLGDWALGLLMFELFSLLFFWTASKFFGLEIESVFYFQLGITAGFLMIERFFPLISEHKVPSSPPTTVFVASLLVLISLYTIFFGDMVLASLNNDGVIYQDIIYHAGISQAIMQFGFPIPNLQVDGNEIRYHILTHFFVAKIAYITKWPVVNIYMTLMPIMFSALYSAATISFFSGNLTKTQRQKKVAFLATILAPLMIGIVGGTRENLGYWHGPWFSYSYGWQLVILALLFDYLRSSYCPTEHSFKSNPIVPLALILVLATLIKASSLPLILGGFGVWFCIDTFKQRRFEVKFFFGLVVLTTVGLITYLLFFAGNAGTSGDAITLTKLNNPNLAGYDSSLWQVVLNKLGLQIPAILKLVIWIAAIISYRIVLAKDWRDPSIQVFVGLFAFSLLFYFYFPTDPGYFLKPAIFVGNILAISFVVNSWGSLKKGILVGLMVLVAFSSYPLSLGQLNGLKKFEQKRSEYLPLTQLRGELYHHLRQHTHNSDVIFTTSCYGVKPATEPMSADNFYPPVLSGRQFWFCGYRFGNFKSNPSYAYRISLTNDFSLESAEDAAQLKSEGLQFLLIETAGNNQSSQNWDVENEFNNPLYTLLFSNDAGAVLSVN